MIAEPHKIKTIRKFSITPKLDREVILREAFYNTFNIESTHVNFDMTSQGTSAKSQEQESGSLVGDETYAGSRNFEKLQEVVKEIFNHDNICPTHNLKGAHKLITTTMVNSNFVYSNSILPRELVEYQGGTFELIENAEDEKFMGNIKLSNLEAKLSRKDEVAYIYIDVYACGFMPVSFSNIKETIALAEKHGTKVVLNLSQVVELAEYYRKNDSDFTEKSLSEIILTIGEIGHILVIDAAQDARCNVGGLIAANDYPTFEKYMNEVVLYEGLHTYGGMAGRTMESFARGLQEMTLEPQNTWITQQVDYFSELLKNVPHYKGADGIYIKAAEFLPQIEKNQSNALAAMLYKKSGIRCIVQGKFGEMDSLLAVQIPRLALSNTQLDNIAKAINELYAEKDLLTCFKAENTPVWVDETEYSWNNPDVKAFDFECEAHSITTIEYVGVTTKEARQKIIEEAGFNTFLLPSKNITIDLLTDSGTTAQSTEQWSEYNEGAETPASSKDYFSMVEALKDVTGYKYIIPTHQGRAAEHIMSQVLIKDGFIPGNMYFTTTKLHQELAGGTFVDVICDEAHDPTSKFIWKGNVVVDKVKKILDEHGEGSIPYISFELSVNLAGGQPISMDNAKEVYAFCKAHKIPVMFDATRAVENAYMIKKKDERYANASIKDILRELFSYSDGCTVSSKKDYLVNIGGFLGIRDDEDFYNKAQHMLRIFEGTRTNGGMSAGDMAVHAKGVYEMVDINYIQHRVEQTQYLGNLLLEAGVPIVEPIGTHAVFLDARRFLPHIDQENYPAQALASALYVETGVRAMERGNVSGGRNKKTGKNYQPKLELVRLTIPRRAYTNSHMDLIAKGIINLYTKRDKIKGLDFVYEPANLRFFQGRFEEI